MRHLALLVLSGLLFCQPRAATAHPHKELVPTLVVPLVEQAPEGLLRADVWATVPTLSVDTTVGETVVPVKLSACRTADAWFVRCTWADASADVPKQGAAPKPGADGVVLTWAANFGTDGLVQPEQPSVFEAGKGEAAAASGHWDDGRWAVQFRRLCPVAEGKAGVPPGALKLTVSDPSRGVAESGPVRVRPGGASQRRSFEEDVVGAAAKGFRSALAGKGKPPSWLVRNDGEKAGNRLVQEAQDEENERYPLALMDGFSAKDVYLSARFQARKGFKDRAAGLVWRVKDEKNHYILRANMLEGNVVLYKMQDGLRIDLPPVGHEADYGVNVEVEPEAWHTLRVTALGDRFQAYLNGRLLFDVVDTTFPDGGGVGLWTKSDSVIAFDDLVVVSLDPPKGT